MRCGWVPDNQVGKLGQNKTRESKEKAESKRPIWIAKLASEQAGPRGRRIANESIEGTATSPTYLSLCCSVPASLDRSFSDNMMHHAKMLQVQLQF